MIHNVGNFILQLPDGHQLPNYQATDRLYDRGFIPLLRVLFDQADDGWIVDVGANVGDTACLFASLTSRPMICVEGSAQFLPYLRRNVSQIVSEVIVCEQYIYHSIIDDMSLRFTGGATTGSFQRSESLDGVSNDFITIDEVRQLADGKITLFKCDTDGLDVPIVEAFLRTPESSRAAIFMELGPNYTITSSEYIHGFLGRLRYEGYQAAVFSNRGVPLVFLGELDPNVVEDLLRHSDFSQASAVLPYHYLDLFLFPPTMGTIFSEIANGYRTRRFM